MLSLFPEILFLAPFSAFVIRVAVALMFANVAWTRLGSADRALKTFAYIDVLISLSLLLGLYTQLAALIGLLCTAAWLLVPKWCPLPRSTVVLLLVMCLSLLVTGPGPFGFDLPL